MKKTTPKLVSITYKVGTKLYTASLADKKTKNVPKGLESSCGENCRCVDGYKERYITWGGLNTWVKTNEPCI